MLKKYTYQDLDKATLAKLVKRNTDDTKDIRNRVEEIIKTVKIDGDKALISYAQTFDQVSLTSLYVTADQIKELAGTISAASKNAIDTAFKNIYKFHKAQLKTEDKIETTPGVVCWRENRAIEKVGLYIPGGTAVLPSTFLMLGIPARIAGCKEIIVCSPPQKNGTINGYIAYVALLLNIDRIYLAGGAQAIAAMAYGTETITKTDKIFGPGNQYVTTAKSLVQSNTLTAIDMPAGPSEVLIIADDTANPDFVAADLLAQAEHGTDSQSVLVSNSAELIDATLKAIDKQLKVLPRAGIAVKALENSYALLTPDLKEALNFSNEYAPEHLILATDNWQPYIKLIVNAGSVFLGNYSPESAGDYASGTNHTLPTSAFAKAYSGVSVDSFIKKITFQHLNEKGIQNLGPIVEVLAEMEGLQAHKNAVSVRLAGILSYGL